MKELFEKLSFLSKLKRMIAYKIYDCRAYYSFKRVNYRKSKTVNESIRVVFMCQYLPAWNKVKSIYSKMQENDKFAPILLCIPSNVKGNELAFSSNMENDTYRYFVKQGYSEAINALSEIDDMKVKWTSLKNMKPDYVIYTRPYNCYMPAEYTSAVVAGYSRVCLVMYSSNLTREMVSTTLNRIFLAYTYCYFTNASEIKRLNESNNLLCHRKGLQMSVNCGMLAAEEILSSKSEISDSWKFSHNDFRVIWSPRWTTDPAIGGSNFFVYKDALYEYAREHGNIDFLYRPHPMMWDNFEKTGEMTRAERQEYISKCEALPNIRFDKESEYSATIWHSDVLISDISGLIPEYLVTGKPVIYCVSDKVEYTYTEQGEKIIDACYVVRNQKELFDVLQELREGADPLQDNRKQLISDEFFLENRMPSEIVIETLINNL